MSRISLLSAAFRETTLTCGELVLRPLTAGTLNLLMETGNPLFLEGRDGAAEPTEAEANQALFEFLFIHTAPEEDVLDACETPGVLRRRARRLGMDVAFEHLEDFGRQFGALMTRINAAVVEVLPEKGEAAGKPAAGETPPPTGSPHSSTPSAAMPTPPASAGSSGSSPSSAPSSTSTPPTARTEPAPVGRSRIWAEDPVGPGTDEAEENVIPLP